MNFFFFPIFVFLFALRVEHEMKDQGNYACCFEGKEAPWSIPCPCVYLDKVTDSEKKEGYG